MEFWPFCTASTTAGRLLVPVTGNNDHEQIGNTVLLSPCGLLPAFSVTVLLSPYRLFFFMYACFLNG
uniref:Uncharacterized protein n=1 Tax=Oryza brachyantha TaxID=4533 RepID=J3M661_ORYBR